MEKFEDLVKYGLITAGRVTGDVSSFRTNIDLIYQGKLIDKSRIQELSEKEKNEIHSKINELTSENNQIAIKLDSNNSEIEFTEKEINKLEDDLNNAKNSVNIDRNETFKWHKFIINLIILLAISGFLIFYYLFVLSNAFKDANEIAQIIADGENPLALPNWSQIINILNENVMLFFSAFIFFGFGYAIHVLLEGKSKLKYVSVSFIVLITLVFDLLLALKIHEVNNEARSLIGEAKLGFFESPILLILIIMGFVVFILWSILFDAVTKEWAKRDILNVIKNKILNKQNDLKKLKLISTQLKQDLEKNKDLILQMQNDINKVKIKISDIEYSITQFTKGWLDFISGLNNENLTLEIEKIKDEFILKLNSKTI